MAGRSKPKILFSIGHSTHTFAEFVALLKAHGIETVLDIRTIPKSRYCPQFNEIRLKNSLRKHHIGYCHLPELGGFRHSTKDSLNTGWRNSSFRGFADYMQTPSFHKAISKLEKIARKKRCVLMCAEAVPWRCHRSLIADAMTSKKWEVFHIQSKKTAKLHEPTPFLKIVKGQCTYPIT